MTDRVVIKVECVREDPARSLGFMIKHALDALGFGAELLVGGLYMPDPYPVPVINRADVDIVVCIPAAPAGSHPQMKRCCLESAHRATTKFSDAGLINKIVVCNCGRIWQASCSASDGFLRWQELKSCV